MRRFLYDVNLAHLYVVSEADTRGSAGGLDRIYKIFGMENCPNKAQGTLNDKALFAKVALTAW